jgi:two-component system OmpR family response regulator
MAARSLQPREFRLLEYLMKHAGQVVTRTMLLENVWDYHFDPQTNVIDVHISRLRSKIDKGFERPLLHTIRGAGYRGGSIISSAPPPRSATVRWPSGCR